MHSAGRRFIALFFAALMVFQMLPTLSVTDTSTAVADSISSSPQNVSNTLGDVKAAEYLGSPVTLKWYCLDEEMPTEVGDIRVTATWGSNQSQTVTPEIKSSKVWEASFTNQVPIGAEVVFTVSGSVFSGSSFQAYGYGAYEDGVIAITSMYPVTLKQTWLGTEPDDRPRNGINFVMTAVSGVRGSSTMGSLIVRENFTVTTSNDENGVASGTQISYFPRYNFDGLAFGEIDVLLDTGNYIAVAGQTTHKPGPGGTWVTEIEVVNTTMKTYSVHKTFTDNTVGGITSITVALVRITNPKAVALGATPLYSTVQSRVINFDGNNWPDVTFNAVQMGGQDPEGATGTYAGWVYTVVETAAYTADEPTVNRQANFDKTVTLKDRVFNLENTLLPDNQREVRIRITKTFVDKLSDEEQASLPARLVRFRIRSINTGGEIVNKTVTLSIPAGQSYAETGNLEVLPRWVNDTEEYEYIVEEISDLTTGSPKYTVTTKVDIGETEEGVITWAFRNERADGTVLGTKLWNDGGAADVSSRPHIKLYLMRDGEYVLKSDRTKTTTDISKAYFVSSRDSGMEYLRTNDKIAEYIFTGLPIEDTTTGRQYVYTLTEEYDIVEGDESYKKYYKVEDGMTVENIRYADGKTTGNVTKTWDTNGNYFDTFPAVELEFYEATKASAGGAGTLIKKVSTSGGQNVNQIIADLKRADGTDLNPQVYDYYFKEVKVEGAVWQLAEPTYKPYGHTDRYYILFSEVGEGTGTWVGNVSIKNVGTGSYHHEKKTLYIAKKWNITPPDGVDTDTFYNSLSAKMKLYQYTVDPATGEEIGTSSGFNIKGTVEELSGGNSSYDKTSKEITINGNSYIAITVAAYDTDGYPFHYRVVETPIDGFKVNNEKVTDNYIVLTNTQLVYPVSAIKIWDMSAQPDISLSAVLPLTLKLYRWIDGVSGSGEVVAESSRSYGSTAFDNEDLGIYKQNVVTEFGNFPTHAYVEVKDKDAGTSSIQLKEYRYKVIESYNSTIRDKFIVENANIVFADGKGYTEVTNRYDPTSGGMTLRVRKEINSWWNPPQSVIEVLARGERIILTDPETGITTNGVFTDPLPYLDAYKNLQGDTQSFNNLPTHDEQGLIPYSVREISIGGVSLGNDTVVEINNSGNIEYYEWIDTKEDGYNFTVVNEKIDNMPESYDIIVHKEWEGIPKADWGTQPTVYFALRRSDGYRTAAVAVNASTNWQTTFKDVKYEDGEGKPYSYVIVEENPPNGSYPYVSQPIKIKRQTVDPKALYGEGTLTNTPVDTQVVTVKKLWDVTNDTSLRPKTVMVRFSYTNGDVDVELSENPSTGAWEGEVELPVVNQTGGYVQFTVSEYVPDTPANAGKDNHQIKSIDFTGVTKIGTTGFTLQNANDPTVSVTNTLKTTTEFKGHKQWVGDGDENIRDTYRPNTITVQLKGTVSNGALSVPITSHTTAQQTRTVGKGGMHNLSDDQWKENNWEWSISGVSPKFAVNNAGVYEEVTYVWEETAMTKTGGTAYYTATTKVGQGNKGSSPIVNTIAFTGANGAKQWDDSTYSALRPSGDITVQLYRRIKDSVAAWTIVTGKTATAQRSGANWNWSFTDLPMYAPITGVYEYGVLETTKFTGYTTPTVVNATTPMNVVNKLDTGSLTITKNWIGDTGTGRPNVTFTVQGKTASGQTLNLANVTLNGTETTPWSKTIEGLPLYDYRSGNAEQITYTVTENELAGSTGYVYVVKNSEGVYEQTADRFKSTALVKDGVKTIVMENMKINTQSLSGTKTWVDTGAESNRPKNTAGDQSKIQIVLQYTSDGGTTYKDYGEMTFYSGSAGLANTFTFTWPNPVPNTIDGQAVTYRFYERVPSYYVASSNQPAAGAANAILANGSGILTNTLSAVDGIGGEKAWNDDNSAIAQMVRPTKLYISFFRDAADGTTTTVETNKEITENEGKFAWNWTGLLGTNASGSNYERDYVTEIPMTGYTTTIDGMNVTNKLKTFNLQVTKDWAEVDGKPAASYDDVEFTLYGYTTPTFNAGTALFSKTLTLKNGQWTGTINNLPLYDSSSVTRSGNATTGEKAIKYVLVETPVAGYNLSVTSGSATVSGSTVSLVINNADANLVDSTVSIGLKNTRTANALVARKVWVNDSTETDSRPASITLRLSQRKVEDGPVTDTWPVTVDRPEGGWPAITEVHFNVPESYDGGTYIYSLTEDPIDGYTAEITENKAGGKVTSFTVSNTLNKVDMTVRKQWIDNDNSAALRPTSLSVSLYRQVGSDASTRTQLGTGSTAIVPTVDANDDSLWTLKWPTQMPEYYEGTTKYVYTFVEDGAKIDMSYALTKDTANANDATDGGLLKNTLETKNITGSKTWLNENIVTGYTPGLSSVRPDGLTISLHRYTKDTQGEDDATLYKAHDPNPVPVGATTSWAFNGVPVYANARSNPKVEYGYVVREAAVKGYNTTNATATNISNSLQTIDIIVEKSWDDNNNTGNTRPPNLPITLTAKAGNTVIATIPATLQPGASVTAPWTKTFSGMPQYYKGTAITYSVAEDSVPGGYMDGSSGGVTYPNYNPASYTIPSSNVPSSTTLKITNKLGTATFGFVKTWVEGTQWANTKLITYRPATVTVQIWRSTDADMIGTSTVIGNEGEDGSVRTYGSPISYNVADLADLRTGTGKIEQSIGDMEARNPQNKLYYYWVVETVPTGYDADYPRTADDTKTMAVTNTLKTVDITIEKTWVGDEMTREYDAGVSTIHSRPTQIGVTLIGTAGNAEVYSEKHFLKPGTVPSEPDKWALTVSDLPLYSYNDQGANPQLIQYSVVEDDLLAYTVTYDNSGLATSATAETYTARITNTWNPVNITAIKKFEGDEALLSNDEVPPPRPSSLAIWLERYAGDSVNRDPNFNVSITRADIWADDTKHEYEYDFGNLPTHDVNNEPYTYVAYEAANAAPGYQNTRNTKDSAEPLLVLNSMDGISVSGTKTWHDNKTDGGDEETPFRKPVTLTLSREYMLKGRKFTEKNIASTTITNVNEGNSQTYNFGGQQMYKDPSDPSTIYTYIVEESDVPFYTTVINPAITDEDGNITIDISNTMSTVDITVDKSWIEPAGATRPGVTITLRATTDGTTSIGAPFPMTVEWDSTETNATPTQSHTFAGMPKRTTDGTEIIYVVEENSVPGYVLRGSTDRRVTVDFAGGTSATVSLVNERQTGELIVSNEWRNDNDDADETRPLLITATLVQTDSQGDRIEHPMTFNQDSGVWETEKSFAGLSEIDNYNQPYDFTIEKDEVLGYRYDIVENRDEDSGDLLGFTIINTLVPITISVDKDWMGDAQNLTLRPADESLTLALSRRIGSTGSYAVVNAAELVKATTVSGDTWTFEWTVPAYYKATTAYEYAVQETLVPKYYTATVDFAAIDATNPTSLVNTLDTITITGTKEWVVPTSSFDQISSLVPSSLTVQLWRRGTGSAELVGEQTVTNNAWTFANMPANESGTTKYTYWVEETDVPVGYDTEPVADAVTGFETSLKNTMQTTNIHVNKTSWGDDGFDPEVVRPDDYVEITLTGTYEGYDPYTDTPIVATGRMLKPSTPTDTWTVTFSGMPRYVDGKPVTYSITETVPTGYATTGGYPAYSNPVTPATSSTPKNATMSVQNMYDAGSYTFNKIWERTSYETNVGLPNSITVDLYRSTDPADAGSDDAAFWVSEHTYPVTDMTGISEEITGLEKVNTTSKLPYTYWVIEQPIKGYVAKEPQNSLTVTNELDKVSINVIKNWEDAESYYTDAENNNVRVFTRPSSISITLEAYTRSGGKTTPIFTRTYTDFDTANSTGDDTWEYLIENLPRYAYNDAKVAELITYRVVEATTDAYATTQAADIVLDDTTNAYEAEITNDLVVGPINVSKQFTGDASMIEAGIKVRPDTVVLTLRRQGDAAFGLTTTLTIGTEIDGRYTYTFDNLPLYNASGAAYTYYVEENGTPGYALTDASRDTLNLVNNLDGTSVTVKKVWQDFSYGSGLGYAIRPEYITVKLTRLAQGETTDPTNFEQTHRFDYDPAVTEQSYTFSGLKKVDDAGKTYVYSATEVSPTDGAILGYELTTTNGTNEDGTQLITLTNKLQAVDIKVSKHWIDGPDLREYRPTNGLPIHLVGKVGDTVYYRGSVTAVATNPANPDEDTWVAVFENVPRYAPDGTLITYTVSENLLSNYQIIDNGIVNPVLDDNLRTTEYEASITNQQRQAVLTIFKDWDDEAARPNGDPTTPKDSPIFARPTELWVNLEGTTPDGKVVYAERLRITGAAADTRWQLDVTGLAFQAYDNSGVLRPITYTVTEEGSIAYRTPTITPTDLTPATDTPSENGFAFVIENELDVTDIAVTKEFLGDSRIIEENADYSPRPTSITVRLMRDGGADSPTNPFVLVGTITMVDGQDTYNSELVFTDLPKYDWAGNEYRYYVREDTVNGYKAAYVSDHDITNTLETTQVSGTKVWDDDQLEGQYRVRPASITIELTRMVKGATQIDPDFVLTRTINRSHTTQTQAWSFVDLPKYDKATGRLYEYYVRELDPNGDAGVKGYTQVISPEGDVAGNTGVTITNTLDSASVSVQKIWQDTPDTKQYRPLNGLEMTLTGTGLDANGATITYYSSTETAMPPTSGNDAIWRATFDRVPKYDQQGNAITYTLTEDEAMLPNYERVATVNPVLTDGDRSFTTGSITNKQRQIAIRITKNWDDELARDNGDATNPKDSPIFYRPASLWVNLVGMAGDKQVYTGRHEMTAEFDTVNGTQWSIVVGDLPVQAYDNGNVLRNVTYTVTEEGSTAFETPSIVPSRVIPATGTAESDGNFLFTITNTLDVTDIPVTKLFTEDDYIIGENPAYSPRPTSITVKLYRDGGYDDPKNPFVLVKTLTMVDGQDLYDTEMVFTDLPLRDWAGNEYRYYVREETVNGYKAEYDNNTDITNVLQTVEVSGTKEWDDDLYENQYRVRPEFITIELTRRVAGATEMDDTFVLTQQINRSHTTQTQGWSFPKLPKFDKVSGRAYEYFVRELDPDGNPGVKGYTQVLPTDSVAGNGNVTIANTLDRTDIRVNKVWQDGDELKQYRPLNGLDITLTGTGHAADGTTEIEYYKRTITAQPPTSGDDNTWTVLFDGVPRVGQDGELITYAITEETPLNYELVNTTNPVLTRTGDTFTGTLTNRQKVVEIDVEKEWDDEVTRDDNGNTVTLFRRPATLTFTVTGTANGHPVYDKDLVMDSSSIDDDYNWSKLIEDLPRYAYDASSTLAPVVYTVAEVGSVAYTTAPATQTVSFTDTQDSQTISVKNTIVTENIPITKRFTEDDLMIDRIKQGLIGDEFSPRPATLTVRLHRSGGEDDAAAPFELVHTFTVDMDNNTYDWTFPDLPTYDWAGNAYNYYIDEDSIFGYDEVSTDKTDKALVNELQVVEVSGTKVWDDDDRYGGYLVRPEYITIELTRRIAGTTTAEAGFVLTQKIDYEYTDAAQTWRFPKLARVDKATGQPYEYLVRELDPAGNPTVNGYTQVITPAGDPGSDKTVTITNTLKRIDITVSKTWLDGDELKQYRPLNGLDITLVGTGKNAAGETVIYYNETQNATAPTSGDDSVWTTEFIDLPQYGSDGVLIEYTIAEADLLNYDMTKREHPVTNDAGVVSGGSFENTQKTVEIVVNKEWDDELVRTHSGEDVVLFRRPDTLTFTVRGTAGGHEVYLADHTMDSSEAGTVVDAMNWTMTVDNLPHYAYDANNVLRPVIYTVTEHGSDAYDTTLLVQTVTYTDTEDSKTILFENEIVVDDVTITSEFIGDEKMLDRVKRGLLSAEFSPRPVDTTVYLQRRGGQDDPANPFQMTQVIPVNDDDKDYDFTFPDLPVYDWDGNEYEYYVTEEPINGYEEVSPETYDLALINELLRVDISGDKVWDDDKNPNGEYLTRPDTLTIELTRQARGASTPEAGFSLVEELDYDKAVTVQDWLFDELPQYSKVNNAEYQYLIHEIGPGITTDGVHAYGNTYASTGTTGDVEWTITNTLKRIDIDVRKTWIDGTGLEDYRPATAGLDVTLTGIGEGNVTYYQETKNMTPPATGTSNVWTTKFSSLPLYDRNGDLIEYSVTEDLPIMYSMTANEEIITAEDARNTTFTASIENTLKTETYSGKKTWVDEDNKHKTRPESIDIDLKREYIDPTTKQKVTEVADSLTVTAPWEWSFDGMPVYHKSGVEYTYFVEETTNDGRYEVSITGGDRMSLTNTLITQDVTIKKNWDDVENRYNTRPTSVNITLTSSTGLSYRGAITSVRGWEFVFSGLPKYTADKKLVTYTLGEDAIADYEIKGDIVHPTSSETATSYTGSITNAMITTQAQVTKAWSGGTDRPSVTINLLEGSRQIESVTLSASNNWTHTFENLPRTRNGSTITYTVAEVKVENYTSSIQTATTAQGFAFTVTNTYNPPATATPRPSATTRPGGSATPRPSATTPPGGTTVPPGNVTTLEPDATPSPTPAPRRNNYVTLLDLEVPLGYGSALNLGECFD